MAKKNQTPPRSYEDAVEEIEKILAEIESSNIGLEENLQKYDRAHFLLQYCRTVLNSAEKQIETINKSGDGATPSAADAEPQV